MIAVKRCPCPDTAWRKCPHDWYMPKLRHAGAEYAPNVTRYAADVLGRTITTATEADAVIVDVLRPAIRTGAYVSAKANRRAVITQRASTAAGATIATVITAFTADVINANLQRTKATRGRETTWITRFGAFIPKGLRAALGTLTIATLTDDDLRAALVAFRQAYGTLANSTWAKPRTVLGQFFRYAKARGYRETDPIASADDLYLKSIKRGKQHTRHERIDDAAEARLIGAALNLAMDPFAGRRLARFIVAAVETGQRKSELLALRWADVHLDTRTIRVRAEEAGARKTGDAREVPISARLLDVLRDILAERDGPHDPRFLRHAYVFGTETGERVTEFWHHWAFTVLLAHGHAAQWKPGTGNLSAASSALYHRINWHVHDLRHEAGCRWLESKIFDLEQIRQLYGHATVAQTARYLHAATRSAFRAMPEYDAYRARLANADKTAAATALDTGRRGDKLGTNAKRDAKAGSRPRLVKSDKL